MKRFQPLYLFLLLILASGLEGSVFPESSLFSAFNAQFSQNSLQCTVNSFNNQLYFSRQDKKDHSHELWFEVTESEEESKSSSYKINLDRQFSERVFFTALALEMSYRTHQKTRPFSEPQHLPLSEKPYVVLQVFRI